MMPEDELSETFQRHYGDLVRYGRAQFGLSSDDAEDVAQVVLIRLWQQPADDVIVLRKLFRLFKSEVINRRISATSRERRERLWAASGAQVNVTLRSPDRAVLARIVLEAVVSMIPALSDVVRPAFCYRFLSDYNFVEISEALSVPYDTAYHRVRLAKEQLAELLGWPADTGV